MFALKRLSFSFCHHQAYNKIIRLVNNKIGVIYLNSPSDLNALSSDLKN